MFDHVSLPSNLPIADGEIAAIRREAPCKKIRLECSSCSPPAQKTGSQRQPSVNELLAVDRFSAFELLTVCNWQMKVLERC